MIPTLQIQIPFCFLQLSEECLQSRTLSEYLGRSVAFGVGAERGEKFKYPEYLGLFGNGFVSLGTA